jgi:hypothetical protein
LKRHTFIPAVAGAIFALAMPLYAQSVTGSLTDLTTGSIEADLQPRLNSNATKIVYTNTKGDFDLSYTYDNLYVMNVDGSSKTGPLAMQSYAGGNDNWAALSPDGTYVICQKTGDWTADYTFLCAALISPITPAQLTLSATTRERYPTFNSDGTKIAWVSDSPGSFQLFTMKSAVEDSSTNPRVQLTNWTDGGISAMPFGTPDGKVLFVKQLLDGDGNVTSSEIWKVDLADSNGDGEGNNLTQITSLGGIVSSPSQPTSGGRIFFLMAAKDGTNHVFSVNATGGDLHQVTGGNFDEETPCAAQSKLVVSFTDVNNGAGNADIGIYTLSTATANGTVSGTFTGTAGAVVSGATVNAYDGSTLKASTTTSSTGAYSLSLAPGGYTLEFVTTDNYTVTRSVLISSGGTVTQDAFTTPTAAPRPSGLIATIKGTTVELRWHEAGAPSTGFSLLGYNIYRATAEIGPWTKVNSTPILSTDAKEHYIDTTPGSLATAFYKASTVTTDGVNTKESAFTAVAQAANDLMFNPSFEQVDTSGNPIGWTFSLWAGNGTGGTVTTYKVDGTKSAAFKAGDSFGAMLYQTPPEFYLPVQPGVAFVQGFWGKFTDTQTTWPLSLKLAEHCPADYIYWYPNNWDKGPDLGPWDTIGLTNGGGDTDWVWLYQTDGAIPYQFSDTTRFSLMWPMDSLATANSSTAYADDVTYQVKRFGATGWVMGRIVDTNGNVPAGITVTCGGQSIVTTGSNTFVIPNVPTGSQTLTIKVPGAADYSTTITNYGGYRLPTVYVAPVASPLIVKGTIYNPDGTVCSGATVRLVTTDSTTVDTHGPTGNTVGEFTTTTDSTGQYSFGSDTVNVAVSGQSVVVASKKGFISNKLWKLMGTSGINSGNDIKLIAPSMIVQIPKTTTPPTIDGHVNLATEWAGAQPVQMFLSSQYPAPLVKTMVYAKYDDTNLYLAFVADEPNPSGIYAPTTTHDGGMWGTDPYWNGDDLFELDIDPTNGTGTGQGHEWWQIQMNSINVVLDVEWRFTGPFEWGIGSETGTTTANYIDAANNKWYQEVTVPFSGIATSGGLSGATPAIGDEWAFGIARQRHQPLPAGDNMSIGNALVHFVSAVTTVKGDLNWDGVVNNADVVYALKIAAGIKSVDPNNLARGDVNSSSKVDMLDAVKIARKINGLDSF